MTKHNDCLRFYILHHTEIIRRLSTPLQMNAEHDPTSMTGSSDHQAAVIPNMIRPHTIGREDDQNSYFISDPISENTLLSQLFSYSMKNNPRLDQQAIHLEYKKCSMQKTWASFENDDVLNGDEFDSYILHQDRHKRKNEQPHPVNLKKPCDSKTRFEYTQ